MAKYFLSYFSIFLQYCKNMVEYGKNMGIPYLTTQFSAKVMASNGNF